MNLKVIRNMAGVSQKNLADHLGVARSTVAMWEAGNSQPDNDKLKAIASYFSVSVDYLLGMPEYFIPVTTNGVTIKVLGRVAAGVPIEAMEDIRGEEEISQALAATGTFFGLQIQGDSMEPRIMDGDVVIVRQQPDVENGEIAVVLVNGEDATVKKIQKQQDGIMLVSINPNYPPVFYSNEQIAKLPVTIVGRVVQLRGIF
ncbi:helix-turn-helix domain-containing protein [Eubacteriales bacterium OttesenSCG-928-M02]|nr:helix-turn-helix domain-containing protein [Eubacteriales bacterium OttesenSCG-928-M02]